MIRVYGLHDDLHDCSLSLDCHQDLQSVALHRVPICHMESQQNDGTYRSKARSQKTWQMKGDTIIMGLFSKLFGGNDDKELSQYDAAYNQAVHEDMSVGALEALERTMQKRGYVAHWDEETKQFYFVEE
jgi:predicted metal-dependent phosphotriesterase family hydrolase